MTDNMKMASECQAYSIHSDNRKFASFSFEINFQFSELNFNFFLQERQLITLATVTFDRFVTYIIRNIFCCINNTFQVSIHINKGK